MKLNKNTLQWLVYHALHSNAAGQTELNIIKEIDEALEAGTLEIEGYERANWVKFNPNDESTFPPCEGVYLVCRGVEPYFREAKFYGEKVGFGDTCVILWRPLPKLPLEIDGRYIREDRPECFYPERKMCK